MDTQTILVLLGCFLVIILVLWFWGNYNYIKGIKATTDQFTEITNENTKAHMKIMRLEQHIRHLEHQIVNQPTANVKAVRNAKNRMDTV